MNEFRLLVAGAALAGCAGASPPEPVTRPTASAPSATGSIPSSALPTPSPVHELARYVPGNAFKELGDGRVAAVVSGRRIVIANGRATVLDPKRVEDLGQPHRIPVALGGGWLFIGSGSVHFAPELDAPLRRIANGLKRARVGVGRDQLLVFGAPGAPVLYELSTGRKLQPPVTGLRELFGTPSGLVAALTEKGELFVSPTPDAPFKKLPTSAVQHLAYDGKGIVVQLGTSAGRIGPDGSLSTRADEPGMTVSDNVDAFRDPWPDFSRPPPPKPDVERLLEPLTVVLDESLALAVEDEDLVVLDARNGKVVQRHSRAFDGHENCVPIRGGTPAFIGCNDPGAMTLLRMDASDGKPVIERSFKGVYTHDFGEPPEQAPLALAKRCDGSTEVGALCMRRDEKTWKQLPQPADPQKLLAQVPFIVHVAASEEGFAYAFGWLGGGGDLVVVDSRAKKVRRIDKGSLPKWASEGIRWGALGIEDGTLRFLIAGDSPGVLEIWADDSIQAERLQGRMASVGSRALLITAQGGLRETLDGGRSFHDVAPPPGGAPDSGFFRCVAAGCSLGPWHRVGWGP